MGTINTKRVTGRPTLRFETPDDVIAEAVEIAHWERDGELRTLGNWTPGQAFAHLSAWIGYAYDGPPAPVPWYLSLVGRLIKSRILRGPMPGGVKIPGAPGGTYGVENLTTEEGLGRLKRAFERLRTTPPTRPNPVFGPLTHDEWTALHLRHAELHLSFFLHVFDTPS